MPTPEIIRNADVSALSTFRLPARAAELAVIDSPDQVSALPPAEYGELILGGGSNTVFAGNYPGRVVLNRLRGIELAPAGHDVLVTAAAGENWHRLVRHCIDRDLHGLENLAMIPGSVGAAPMQNIGAYGVELAETVDHLVARDRFEGTLVTLGGDECAFGYRNSRFKSSDRGRFLITSVTLRLSRRFRPRIEYPSLRQALDKAGIEQPTARQMAATIMRLRRHRLPDPSRLANAGSFFKNPIVEREFAQSILDCHPGLPHWTMPDNRVKLGAGRMIELLGWKGKTIGQAGVYANHALVLVNHGQATPSDLFKLVDAIVESVEQEFGIRLEPEPLLVGR